MTDCSTTRDWILEADPEELEQDASGEHAGHLAECAECRALADEILKAEAALSNTLDSVVPALDVEAALVRARDPHHATHDRWRHWRLALPLAAAALGGVLLLNRPPPVSVSGFDPATVAAARALGLAGAKPVVRAAGQRVAVLPTENPNITVIWFMESGEQ